MELEVLVPHGPRCTNPCNGTLHLMTPPIERRRQKRINVHWPIRLSKSDRVNPIETYTSDISSGGFCCHSPESFALGESLECRISIPSWRPDRPSDMITLRCKVQVMWTAWNSEERQFGIGCQIETYNVADSDSSSQSFGGVMNGN